MKIEGCCHGQLDSIYASLQEAEEKTGSKVDLLLICGDFQAIRNPADLKCLAVPDKYRQLGGFHKYYSGEAVAPVLTIVIGGNHEASNYMWELYHGGWIAPSIYYLGGAGSLMFNGLRISGASGIYNDRSYYTGHHETMPYTESTMRSIYHTRQYDIFRLAQLKRQRPDIFLSHDWPLNIDKYGDTATLIRFKPYFADEIKRDSLGSPPLMNLLQTLKPPLWFAAHLHAKFAALVKHNNTATIVLPRNQPHSRVSTNETQSSKSSGNPDAIELDFSDGEKEGQREANPDAIDISLSDAEEEARPKQANPDIIELDVDFDEDGEEVVLNVKDPHALPAEAIEKAIQPDGNLDEGAELAKAKAALLKSLAALPDGPDSPEKIDTVKVNENEAEVERQGGQPFQSRPMSIPAVTLDEAATKFLALSKCGHKKQFLQLIDIPNQEAITNSSQLTFDPLWLAILRAFHPQLSLTRQQQALPTDQEEINKLVDEQIAWVSSHLPSGGAIPVTNIQEFCKTAPSTKDEGGNATINPAWYTNPQTEALINLLQLENKINASPNAAVKA